MRALARSAVTNLRSVPAELLGSLEIPLGDVADSFLMPGTIACALAAQIDIR
jgi:hypothetical protein